MENISAKNGMTRRSLLKGAALIGATAAWTGALAGCAPQENAQQLSDTSAPADGSDNYADKVAEAIDCDICVVGAGISGLAAIVQASEGGAKVVALEAGSTPGGNGMGTEGMFGINSSMQKEKGIEITFDEIIHDEVEFFAYKINTMFWRDQYDNAGDNLDWLVSNGVKFSGVVDNYGVGRVETFHWYDGNAGDCYVAPMQAKAAENGAEVRVNTRARQLITDASGAIVGVYAETDSGDVLQVNAKAVILASGGYASNPEKMQKHGIVIADAILNGTPTNVGDGVDMALAAGGFDNSYSSCYLSNALVDGFTFFLGLRVGMDNTALWVNQDGVRYINEDCGDVVQACACNAVCAQSGSYMIATQEIFDGIAEKTSPDFEFAKEFNDLLAGGHASFFKGDTLEDVAAFIGCDAATLKDTVDLYNSYCASGKDLDFNKKAETMKAVDQGPFYVMKQSVCFGTSMGGILVDRNYQCLTPERTPIPGLYAVGTDGCMLYYGTYTIEVPASIGGNNLNSGRTAAKHALTTL